MCRTTFFGARNGFRGAGASRRSEIANGRDKHALVTSGRFPDGSTCPPLLAAYTLRPGGSDKHDAAITTIDLATRNGITLNTISADRGYPANTFGHAARLRGIEPSFDQLEHQHRTRIFSNNILEIDGGFFTDGTPTPLRKLDRFTRNMPTSQRGALTKKYDQRTAFAYRRNGTTNSGAYRFRGPAIPDRITTNTLGITTTATGMRVNCPNSPYTNLAGPTIPTTDCTPGQPCGCSLTFTIKEHDYPPHTNNNTTEPAAGTPSTDADH